MRYVSTRGGMAPAAFSDILLEGLAPDGGLVVPETVPTVDRGTLESWRKLTYAKLATEVIGLFWSDIARDDLRALCERAYGPQFRQPVPLTPIGEGIALVGLSEGPTLAFKDMAMQFLGEAIPYVLTQRQQTLNILGATSGDTGSAAEYAFRAKPRIAVFMLSPQGRMSDFQRAQMYSLTDENIHNIAIDGVFDDCQNLVKELNGDLEFKTAHTLGTVNSINLGRIVAQTVYYFWAWLRASDGLVAQDHQNFTCSFAVPSGNFGNIYSGHLAKLMGLPIHTLVLATNENNVLDEFFRTARYAPRSREETLATSSPSMDISKASNLERFIFDLVGRDAQKLCELWRVLETAGSFALASELGRFRDEFGFVSGSSTHADRIATIREVFERSGVIIDPHTADGVRVASQVRAKEQAASGHAGVADDVPMLVLETALPQKFADTVTEALGKPAPLTADLEALLTRKQRTVEMDADGEKLRAYIHEHYVKD